MTTDLFGEVQASATISECGMFRYDLVRQWDAEKPTVNFIMLNPSTADGQADDPTIRRCMGFAKSWGCGRLVVTNLFALRSTDPKRLIYAYDPLGAENDKYLALWAKQAELVVCAWGTMGYLIHRDLEVKHLLRDQTLYVLKLTAGGHPSHPLYLPKSLTPTWWVQE